MKVTKIALLTTLALLSWSSIASSTTDYGPLQNHATGKDYCLTPMKDKSGIILSNCNGSTEQNWKVISDVSGYFRVYNESIKDKCLRTLVNGRTVQLGSCNGDGYTSMRLWTVSHNVDGSITFINKYSKDLGRNETLNADANTNTITMSAANSEPKARWDYSGEEIPSPKRPLTGNKKVLLMATHYNGVTPANPDPIRKAVFGDGDDYSSLQHYLKLASHGELTIEGTFLNNVNIGERPSSCNSGTILESARKAAQERGINPNNYDFLFVDISRSSTCKWEGLAATPGNWIISNGVGHKYWLWTHEFGHNMGLGHSTTLNKCPINDGIVQINNKCISGGGDDATDTMGGGGGKLYPVNYQLFAGWLKDKDVPLIKEPGTYELMPLWQPGGSQGYRIQRSDGSVLILEYRQSQQGFDNWSGESPFIHGITVRTAKYSGSTITNTLVDATPDSASGMKDAPLMPGRSLYDTLSGKLITLLSADGNSALIKVENK